MSAPVLAGFVLVKSVQSLRRCYVREQVRLMNEVGDVVRYGWPLDFLVAFHPRALERILADNAQNYVKSKNYAELAPVMGNGLVTSSGAVWQRSRKAISAELGRQAARAGGAGFASFLEENVAKWPSLGDGVVDVAPAFTELSFRFTATMLLGPDAAPHAAFVHERLGTWERRFLRRVYSIVKTPDAWPTPDAVKSRKGIADVDAFLASFIERFLTEGSSGERWGIMGKLVEACRDESGNVDKRQLRDEIMTLLLAGHDTTAASFTWSAYLLARHPDMQSALAEESRAHANSSGGDVEKLTFHRRFVDESLRMYPPVPGFSRDAVDDDVVMGVPVAKGTKVELSAYATHRHREFWREPERFDPERFSGRDVVDPFAYVPFGKGSRICAGKELAIHQLVAGLASITRTVRFSLVDDREPEPFAAITLRPKDGMKLRVERR